MSATQQPGHGVRQHLDAAMRVLAPRPGDPHGPLPPLLLGLTVATGLVDAFSYLLLGHVLVANMTGNVVFLGFAIGDAPGFVWWALLLALAAFLAGAVLGGRIRARCAAHRGRHLYGAVRVEVTLIAAAWVTALVLRGPYHDWSLALLIVLLGLGLGVQNATARALAVPDLTTTVLTLTLAGIASDSAAAGGSGSKLGRRVMPVLAMLAGGAIGAALVVHGHGAIALGLAAGLLAVITLVARPVSRSSEPWAVTS
ncbi:YoaK family protein [Nocardia sp. NBC_00511]|uniref:YoaK family protein n=1 Tax=Nocardia sp. NBC_00511 TaxID=2903591 RepID=UPI0030DFC686